MSVRALFGILFFALFLLALSCDAPPATTPRDAGLWEKCLKGEHCDTGHCLKKAGGTICIPACNPVGLCDADAVDVCGEPLGTTVCAPTGWCLPQCAVPADCGPGTVCSGGVCVWP